MQMSVNEQILEKMCRAGEQGDALALAKTLNLAAGACCDGVITEEELSRLVDVSGDILWRLERDKVLDDEEK